MKAPDESKNNRLIKNAWIAFLKRSSKKRVRSIKKATKSGVSYQHVSGDFQNLGFIAGLISKNLESGN
jgi:hypothetical protein